MRYFYGVGATVLLIMMDLVGRKSVIWPQWEFVSYGFWAITFALLAIANRTDPK